MRNLRQTISDVLLPRVDRPGQYIGLEVNALNKDVETAEVSVAIAFPDAYTIGISHLGGQVLYHLLNRLPGIACDRSYCPEPDAETVMREHGIPLFGWESRVALADFDLLGFSLPYEVCATNVLTMLDLAGIPFYSADRDETHPILLGGDALADSPEPMAEFIDLFIPGDGEQPLAQLVELVRRAKRQHLSREEILLQAAREIPSVYVPRFYTPRYHDDGTLAELKPNREGVPATIQRACLKNLSDSPAITAPLVPISEGVHERVIIEIMRGCPNACRFCQAGFTRLPLRYRSVDEILELARQGIANTGYDEISLLSLSTSDYPHLDELIERLTEEFTPKNVSISLPSLRVDSQLKLLPKLTSAVRKGGLTIAAEAGSERLRQAIRKNITEEDMFAGVRAAYEAGWKRVKVYFIAGLPGETVEDLDAIIDLCKKLSYTGKAIMGQPGSISASVSWFVPKPHTPMQWSAMQSESYFEQTKHYLRDRAQRTAVNVKFHWTDRSALEGVLCRGDRRIAGVIEAAWRNGARMDAWNEHFHYEYWQRAFEQTGIDPAFYAQREFSLEETLPWSHIAAPRSVEGLKNEYRKMREILEGGG